ncbi:MAG: hypothetical protein U0694_18390 [Anaerolineae bacterium]
MTTWLPNSFMAAKEVDKHADIYALGVMAYEMPTGEKPFKGGAAQVMFAHLQQPAPDARDVASDVPKKRGTGHRTRLSQRPDGALRLGGETSRRRYDRAVRG